MTEELVGQKTRPNGWFGEKVCVKYIFKRMCTDVQVYAVILNAIKNKKKLYYLPGELLDWD